MATYHRVATNTQTLEDARRQIASQEVWGRPGIGSDRPAVKAYVGPLRPGIDGIEFDTDVPRNRDGHPTIAEWSGPRQGVVVKEGFARIRATITKARYHGTELDV